MEDGILLIKSIKGYDFAKSKEDKSLLRPLSYFISGKIKTPLKIKTIQKMKKSISKKKKKKKKNMIYFF